MMEASPNNNVLNTSTSGGNNNSSTCHSRIRRMVANNNNNTSHTRSTHASGSLSRRRTGLIHAHGNLSRRKLQQQQQEQHATHQIERRPTLPIRELSNPSLVPSSYHSRVYEGQDCSIPSLELKIQTLLNLEGREFLHSSLSSPIPPCREPTVIPSSHSRSTIPIEYHHQASYPGTSLPDANRKQQTLNGGYLHASSSCPIKPVREPSVASLGASSYHSGASGYSMSSTIATNPSTMPALSSIPKFHMSHSDTDYCTSGDEDDDIFSEEDETETETDLCEESDMDDSIYYDDIQIDYPLLGPSLGPLSASAVVNKPPTTQLPPPAITTNTSAGASVGGGSIVVDSVEADELRALKQYWADLGERIDAMEAQRGIQNSLTDLGLRLEALNSKRFSLQQQHPQMEARLSEKPMGIGPAPGDKSKSKSKSRSSSSAKSAPVLPTSSSAIGLDSRGRVRSSKSRGTDRSVSTSRSKSVGAGERPRRSTTSTKRSSRRRSKQSSTTTGGVERSSIKKDQQERRRSSRRSSATGSASLSSSKRRDDGERRSSTGSRRRSSSGQRKLVAPKATATTEGDGNISNHEVDVEDTAAPSPMSSGSKRRGTSSRRSLADATDSVELAPRLSASRRSSTATSGTRRSSNAASGSKSPRSSMKDVSSKSENNIVSSSRRSGERGSAKSPRSSLKDVSIMSKSENDVMVRERASSSRSSKTKAALSQSPGARSTASATRRHDRQRDGSKRLSHHRRSSSASASGDHGSLCSMPALLKDLDAPPSKYSYEEDSDIHDTTDDDCDGDHPPKTMSKKQRALQKLSPRDTMDVNFWKFHQEASNRSLPVPGKEVRPAASRLGSKNRIP